MEDKVILDVIDDFFTLRKIPVSFMLISLLEGCQEWGVMKGGTWMMLMVPERRLGGKGHP